MRTFIALCFLFAPVLAAAQPVVELHTNHGVIVLQLDADKAPKTVENFLTYVREGFYDGTLFHRVIPDYMAQGGGFTANNEKKTPRAPIPNEADNGLKNLRGTLAMSRGGDPDSATSQFFINLADNAKLDYTAPTNRGWGYAVFGKVIKGMEVVEKIQAVEVELDDPARKYAPLKPVIIEKAVLKGAKPGKTSAPAVKASAPAEEEPAASQAAEEEPVEEAATPVETGPSGKIPLDQAPELPDIPAVE
jgi:peptidyl-prolyl cis-trans isomerase B (cyclophilin B)